MKTLIPILYTLYKDKDTVVNNKYLIGTVREYMLPLFARTYRGKECYSFMSWHDTFRECFNEFLSYLKYRSYTRGILCYEYKEVIRRRRTYL